MTWPVSRWARPLAPWKSSSTRQRRQTTLTSTDIGYGSGCQMRLKEREPVRRWRRMRTWLCPAACAGGVSSGFTSITAQS